MHRTFALIFVLLASVEASAQVPARSGVLDAVAGWVLTDHWVIGGYKDRCGVAYRGDSAIMNGQPEFTSVVGGRSSMSFARRFAKADQTSAGVYEVRLGQTSLMAPGEPYSNGQGFRIDLPATFYQTLAVGGEMTISREGTIVLQYVFEPDARMPEEMRSCFPKLQP